MKLRAITTADIGMLREIASYSFETLWSEKDFGYFITHPQGISLGLFINDELKAYVISLCVQGDLDIISLAVHQENRRQGLAKQLMERVVVAANVSRVFLEVESTNLAALELYKKLGMVIYGVRKRYYGGTKDAVLMKSEVLKPPV